MTGEELEEIRRLWVFEKHEIEDHLPAIYTEATGMPYPGPALDDHLAVSRSDVDALRELCGDDELHFEMTRALIGVERQYRTKARRSGLYEALEKVIARSFYDGEDDAVERANNLAMARGLRKGTLTYEDTISITSDEESVSGTS